jgi:hypothetical protein
VEIMTIKTVYPQVMKMEITSIHEIDDETKIDDLKIDIQKKFWTYFPNIEPHGSNKDVKLFHRDDAVLTDQDLQNCLIDSQESPPVLNVVFKDHSK